VIPAITINNYEQYFLLYADGELSAAEEQAVMEFVQKNPQLAGELEMMQELRLPVEPLVFPGKDLLFRNATAEISVENYESYFLLYVDNELSGPERMQVETFVLQHPRLQEEFLVLKQAQLQPEEMVFADKACCTAKKKRKGLYIHALAANSRSSSIDRACGIDLVPVTIGE
jgi:anti-sigma factor RsiW